MPVIYLLDQDIDFFYRSHFQTVPKKSGGCGQHWNSWSEESFSRRKLRIVSGGSPFNTPWPISQWQKLGNVHGFLVAFSFFFFFKFLAPCFWAEPCLNMFVIWKNLLNGLVQNPPLGFSSRGVAECQAPSTECTICAVSSTSSVAGDYCFSMAGCFYLLKQNNQE